MFGLNSFDVFMDASVTNMQTRIGFNNVNQGFLNWKSSTSKAAITIVEFEY
jgi:hypothetical protein